MDSELKYFINPITWGPTSFEHGYACGYVAIPKGHKYYGVDYDDIDVDVHGGLTHSALVVGDENYDVFKDYVGYWVVGFDTCHAGDNLINCSKEFVIEESKRLLNQLNT